MSVRELSESQRDRMLQTMLRAVADNSRLHLLRLLHQREYSVGDLAVALDLTEPTISHHLTRLREASLVTLRMAGTTRYYRVNEGGLRRLKEWIATLEQMPNMTEASPSDNAWIEALDWPHDEKQVLRDHTDNGVIVYMPAKLKAQKVIVRWLATLFETGRNYTESEVNQILKSVYEPDFVSLRRDMVESKHLAREKNGSRYWLASASSAPNPLPPAE